MGFKEIAAFSELTYCQELQFLEIEFSKSFSYVKIYVYYILKIDFNSLFSADEQLLFWASFAKFKSGGTLFYKSCMAIHKIQLCTLSPFILLINSS